MAEEEKAVNSLVRPGFIVSALLLVALIVGLAFLLFTRENAREAGGDKPVEVSSTRQESGGQAQSGLVEDAGLPESDSVCGLVAHDQVVPSQALPSVPIDVGDRIQVPHVDGYGPGVTEGVSHCFAHTPSGAILASANFVTWFSSKERLDEVVPTLMATGPNRDRLESQIKSQWQGETGSPVMIHGFKYEDRGPDNAMVVLAVSPVASPDKMMGFPVVLVWAGGDWKVEAPSTDSWGERIIDSLPLEGFVEWGA